MAAVLVVEERMLSEGHRDPTHGGCMIYECRPSDRVKRKGRKGKGEANRE